MKWRFDVGRIFHWLALLVIVGMVVLAPRLREAWAAMYRWKDEKGIVHITNTTPPPNAREVKTYETDDAPPAADAVPPSVQPPAGQASASPSDPSRMEKKAQDEMLGCVPLAALFLKAAHQGILLTDMNDLDLATVGVPAKVWKDIPPSAKETMLKNFSQARKECEGDSGIQFMDPKTKRVLGRTNSAAVEILE